MQITSSFTVALTEREISLARTSSGCPVKLPAPTQEIVIKVVEDEKEREP